jgi:Mce-associated membrane protein
MWGVALALAVVAVVLGVVLLTRGDSPRDRRDEVVQASERFALALSSYDYRHLDADFDRVRSMSTAGFREEFEDLLGGPTFADALRASEAVSTARVQTGPLVGSLAEDEARTFTVVEQRITNKDTPEPRAVRTRVELYLVKTTQGWKIDRVSVSS